MSEYLEHITSVEDMKDKINDFALDMYNKGRADAIKEYCWLYKTDCNNVPKCNKYKPLKEQNNN